MSEPLIDFVSIGQQVLPAVPTLRCLPLAAPHCEALYMRRREAVDTSRSEWLCFVDGGADGIVPDFVPAMNALALLADSEDAPIGWCVETEHGRPGRAGQSPHHGVVCRVAALRAIAWPEGCYHWEAIAYRTLRRAGFVIDQVPRYDWRPGQTGAHRWPSTSVGINNASRWLRENR